MKGISAKNQTSQIIAALFVLLIVSLVAMIANFLYVNNKASEDKEYIGHSGELRVLSQQIAKNSTEAAAGKSDAFKLLRTAHDAFNVSFTTLQKGSDDLPAVEQQNSDTLNQQMSSLAGIWQRVSKNANDIMNTEDTVLSLHDVAGTLSETVPQLQIEYDEVVEILLETNAPAGQVALAQKQSWLAERILGSVNKVLEGTEDSVMAADSFGRDASLFGRVLRGMINGDSELGITRVTDSEAIDRLNEISDLFEFVDGSVDEILETSPELFQVREASDQIFADSQQLLQEASKLVNLFEGLEGERVISTQTGALFGLLAVLSIVLIGLVMVRDTRQRLQEQAEHNEQNQAAILRLLDELADLADGDLTVSATVTEDFTGAIADSINFSIDQLRQLVATINNTAVQVASAAQETQATAMHLAEAAEHQAQEIAGASAAVNEMAVSIDQVSANASESAAVAERSVAIANKGNEVVQNTIAGMDTIREQIQDTSKRIKRLGESSQEIGDIVSLINDIADQTNILALNAAIQASMAGDAGRGFAVVADEVQRLAERASAATKQIEALVKTIQTDTNEAVISMEQTTSEVVKGARLAQDAGVALEEIEKVSKNLADLIQNISNAARQQASSAGHISNTMNVIQEITAQTSAGTNATANSIGHLAELATEMRKSVAGFKLPEG
ncbi:type IV pili methyl-accepting chemotaxis transducer N-terminal domain-containing protein [Zooshikella marina]|uniref:methyl-accepting chemotaxis protein n=1 Tax=Zooshikella ganghwensis TaxID=202772 RepID=UPI001BAEC91D|nr:methyl-accepting chemotaxis protein [Zooshikella ganghwensis]MBU2707804.1 type IV pili methyl-accepting chemotaxis transducer N-terminal domain-containing protein [Zooshikella ganghwensis]